MLRFFLSLLILSLLCLAPSAATAEDAAETASSDEVTAPVSPLPDTPSSDPTDRTTPVFVVHSGTDDTGVKLAFALKELFNRASLFRLTDQDEKKLTLQVTTRPEFPSRPRLGSVYSVTWLYSESEGTLKFFLDSEIGTVDAHDAEQIARSIAARTDAVSLRYSYLFE